MIQFHHFHTGGFVLHKVPVGEGTYSAWFSNTGRLLGAERRTRQGTTPVTDRMTNVRSALERIATRYTAEANRLADSDPQHPHGPLATEFDPVS